MKTRKILTALGLVIALTSSNPLTAQAYSDDKLDKIEENLEDYIDEEIETNNESYDPQLDWYAQYRRVQKIIHKIPTKYYFNLVESIKAPDTIKEVLKDCIDDEMYDAAKEAIVYANMANNEQEVLSEVMTFFASRDNGNAFDRSQGCFKDSFNIEDVSMLDNREGKLDIPNRLILFEDHSSYGNYHIYAFCDYESYYGDNYYLITDTDNKILAIVKRVEKKNSYTYLGNQEIYIDTLEDSLEQNGLESEIKLVYTYEELKELITKYPNKIGEAIGLTKKPTKSS